MTVTKIVQRLKEITKRKKKKEKKRTDKDSTKK